LKGAISPPKPCQIGSGCQNAAKAGQNGKKTEERDANNPKQFTRAAVRPKSGFCTASLAVISMHLFRTKPLIQQLARGEISATKKAHYLLASFLMFVVAYSSGFVPGSPPVWTIPALLEAAAVTLITVIGIVKCFDAAGGEGSTDFIAQFTCLYVPVTITTLLVVWSIFWGIAFGFRESLIALSQSRMQFALNLSRLGTDLLGFLSFSAAITVQIATYYRIANALEDVQIACGES
jgi:hypothetical protein